MARWTNERSTQMKLIILTGQLGSGKTTLLNNIVNTLPKNTKTSIIINEFAVLGVDKESISKKVIEVNAGCVCCSKGEELQESVNKLSKESDLTILETTGLASLNGLLEVLSQTNAKITNIILVIDAYAYKQTKGLSDLSKQQIQKATTIIINKADLVDTKTLQELKKNIQNQNTIITKKGQITYKQIQKEHQINYTPKKSILKKIIPELKLDKESKHIQKSGIKSISFETNNEIPKTKLENFIHELPNQINRAKGLFKENNKIYKFNYASGLFYVEQTNKKELQKSYIVLIGKMSRLQKIKYIQKLDQLTGEKTNLTDKIKSFIE